MDKRPKALMVWSSGKDSAYALHVARQQGEVEIVGLLTTVTDAYERVSMHGVREALLEAQAERTGLPLTKVRIPAPCSNEIYEAKMADAMKAAKAQGITHVVFGDLFLADLRDWRIEKLAAVGMEAVFPLWLRDTAALARDMMADGMAARIVCLDPRKLDPALAGHAFDEALLAALPDGVDPCGENGEFHTVVTAGPMFSAPIPVTAGELVEREGFVFADVIPA
jgi:uncharacterized protein (TIGR00290 family)